MHAREWISPATVTFMLQDILDNNDRYSKILSSKDIYFLPLLNPDGYEFSQRSKATPGWTRFDRMWRKNRSNTKWGQCAGVDLNRNFGYKWGERGSSDWNCSETYRGPKPFSEPESRALRDFIMERKDNMRMYLSFHSYGQMIMYPWGYEYLDPKDSAELHRMGTVGAKAMNVSYEVGSTAKIIGYRAAGCSKDWAYGSAGIKYSYTIELPPDKEWPGFKLPASRIKKTAREAVKAVRAMGEDLVRLGL